MKKLCDIKSNTSFEQINKLICGTNFQPNVIYYPFHFLGKFVFAKKTVQIFDVSRELFKIRKKKLDSYNSVPMFRLIIICIILSEKKLIKIQMK